MLGPAKAKRWEWVGRSLWRHNSDHTFGFLHLRLLKYAIRQSCIVSFSQLFPPRDQVRKKRPESGPRRQRRRWRRGPDGRTCGRMRGSENGERLNERTNERAGGRSVGRAGGVSCSVSCEASRRPPSPCRNTAGDIARAQHSMTEKEGTRPRWPLPRKLLGYHPTPQGVRQQVHQRTERTRNGAIVMLIIIG